MDFEIKNGCCILLSVSQLTGTSTSVEDLKEELIDKMGLALSVETSEFYLSANGKLITDDNVGQIHGQISLIPRLLGGKGGFGSMLRAIGAQIEKTTNRDACRDLSGRRLRDINEEQRLKRWFAKQNERELEKAEAKKRKLEKLRKITEGPPLPVIDDPQYNKQRADMADSVHDAVDRGFEVHVPGKAANATASSTVTSSSSDDSSVDVPETVDAVPVAASSSDSGQGKTSGKSAPSSSSAAAPVVKKKLKKLMLHEEFDSCSSSDESADESAPKKAKLAN